MALSFLYSISVIRQSRRRAVAEIPLSQVKVENVQDQSFLSGSLRIPERLVAGNCSMEVLAYDRLEPSKKKQAAEQWIDVTVVNPQPGAPDGCRQLKGYFGPNKRSSNTKGTTDSIVIRRKSE